MLKNIINKASSNPKSLFLIDGLGALLSAFILGFVLTQFESIFGIPSSTLYFLASIPCLLTVYDLVVYKKIENKLGIYLKAIAIMNLLYCLLSISLAYFHCESITLWGWVYMILEVCIISAIAYIELLVARIL